MSLINYFRTKQKPSWASLCTCVYTDKAGRRYYQYNDELDMSVLRKGEIDKCVMEHAYGSDYRDVFQGIKSALGESDRKGNMRPNIQDISYLAQEILDRDKHLIIPEILMKICAHTLIREDEDPYQVDDEILKQKLTTFKTEIQRGGLHDFFHSTGLLKLLGLSSMSMTTFRSNMIASEMMQEESRKIRASILSSK
jgi:hypothetical protein